MSAEILIAKCKVDEKSEKEFFDAVHALVEERLEQMEAASIKQPAEKGVVEKLFAKLDL